MKHVMNKLEGGDVGVGRGGRELEEKEGERRGTEKRYERGGVREV